MRLLFLKMLVTWLASLGVFIPHHAMICIPGHTPGGAPSNCENVNF